MGVDLSGLFLSGYCKNRTVPGTICPPGIQPTVWLLFFLSILLTPFPAQCGGKQVVAGAGPSTEVVKLFFKHFAATPAAQGVTFTVPPRSIKHAGGIRASDKYLFGRTGRPLKPSERDLGKEEILIAQVPISFAAGDGVNLREISAEALEGIYTGKIKNWKAVGGPDASIYLVGREKGEAALSVMLKTFPFMDGAPYQKRFKRDHQVVNFIRSSQGRHALAFGARDNFPESTRLTVTGTSLGVSLGLVHDRKNRQHPLVKAVETLPIRFVANEVFLC